MDHKQAQTRDVGLAIRDFLEGARFAIYRDFDGELEPSNTDVGAETIDCSNPESLVVYLDNGQQFIVRIVADNSRSPPLAA